MRNFITRTILGSSLLLGAITANAQYYPRYQREQYPREYRQDNRDRYWLLNRVQNDLNRAEANVVPLSGERIRLDRIEAQLSRFQNQLSNGMYDREQLNLVIATMEREVDRNSLPVQARDNIADDLNRLRDLRMQLDREHGFWQ